MAGYIGAYKYDDELGVVPQENLKHEKLTDYRQEFVTNSMGTVNFESSFEKFQQRIFALGDSYTQGTGNPSDAFYPFQLSLMLNTGTNGAFEPRVGVVNLGLAAYGLKQEIISLGRYEEIIGTPDVILQLGCHNDWMDDQRFESGYRHGHFVSGNPKYGAFSEFLGWVSNAFEITKRAKLLFSRGGVPKNRANDTNPKESIEPKKSTAELLEPEYMDLRQKATAYGAGLIVSWADCSASYEWLKQWAKREQVGFADWCPALQSVKKVIPHLPLHNSHSGGHYRVWVNTIIAAAYQRALESGGYVSNSSSR